MTIPFSICCRTLALLAVGALPALAVELPDGSGKAETEKLCVQCHDLAKAVSMRQDENGWGVTMAKMIAAGMKGTNEEMQAVFDYLVKSFPPEALPPININTARAIEIESRFSLKRSEAAAILKYRKDHGDFKSIDDLKKVPGVDFSKIEAKQDSLVF
jgi:competence protein ComEA